MTREKTSHVSKKNPRVLLRALHLSMPDVSDVGPPAKGPGLPERIPDAKPPPVKVKIEHG